MALPPDPLGPAKKTIPKEFWEANREIRHTLGIRQALKKLSTLSLLVYDASEDLTTVYCARKIDDEQEIWLVVISEANKTYQPESRPPFTWTHQPPQRGTADALASDLMGETRSFWLECFYQPNFDGLPPEFIPPTQVPDVVSQVPVLTLPEGIEGTRGVIFGY